MFRLTLPNWLWSTLCGLAVTVGVLIALTRLLTSVVPE